LDSVSSKTIAGFQIDDDDNDNNKSVDGEEEQTTITVARQLRSCLVACNVVMQSNK